MEILGDGIAFLILLIILDGLFIGISKNLVKKVIFFWRKTDMPEVWAEETKNESSVKQGRRKTNQGSK